MGFLTPFVALFTHGVDAYKTVKAEGIKQVVAEQAAKSGLRLAKLGARSRRFQQQHQATTDYDQKVLDNRRFTLMDEVIIAVWLGVFVAHFIKPLQPYMKGGWAAMGYTDGPAWWFEFGMVGILVSTLGLMALFKIWTGGNHGDSKASGNKSDNRTIKKGLEVGQSG